jgi:hypothetical protein
MDRGGSLEQNERYRAFIVIVLIPAGGAMALYRLDTGDGARTS